MPRADGTQQRPHDLGVVAGVADRVVVMYAGKKIEQADVHTLYGNAKHPYTWGLLGSTTRVDRPRLEQLRDRGALLLLLVAMSGSTTCPGCGLQLPARGLPWDPRRNASPECWQLYGEVQGFELEHLELVRDLHQLTVDAYAAQHAPHQAAGEVPPISVAYALVGLHLALDRGASGGKVRAAYQRMGKPDPSWPHLPAPERTGAMTVFDVAAAGAMVGSVAGHAKAVRAWAAAVWQAWAVQHVTVAALADRLLR